MYLVLSLYKDFLFLLYLFIVDKKNRKICNIEKKNHYESRTKATKLVELKYFYTRLYAHFLQIKLIYKQIKNNLS